MAHHDFVIYNRRTRPTRSQSQRQLEPRIMALFRIFSRGEVIAHAGGGHVDSGGGYDGYGGGSSGTGPKGGSSTVVTSHEDFPQGNAQVTTYGKGGGKAEKAHKGPFKGWLIGGGTRVKVFGNRSVLTACRISRPPLNLLCRFHPTEPNIKTIPYGFLTIVPIVMPDENGRVSVALLSITQPMTLNTLFPQYYQDLPQNFTRPGGELVQMVLTPPNSTAQFLLVSDNYTVDQTKTVLSKNCTGLNASDPTPFNSTGNILSENIFQFYRGDSAAVIIPGYDNTKELSDSPNLVPNPPLPSNFSSSDWVCLNETIGASIPLMHGGSSHLARNIAVPIAVVFAVVALVWCCRKICMDPEKKRKKKEEKWMKKRKEAYVHLPQYHGDQY